MGDDCSGGEDLLGAYLAAHYKVTGTAKSFVLRRAPLG